MKNYELLQYYFKLDPEECNLHHFGIVQNECVKRGLIEGKIQPINDFSTDIKTTDVNPYSNQLANFKAYLEANPKKQDTHFEYMVKCAEEKRIADNKNQKAPKQAESIPEPETVIEHNRQSTILILGHRKKDK